MGQYISVTDAGQICKDYGDSLLADGLSGEAAAVYRAGSAIIAAHAKQIIVVVTSPHMASGLDLDSIAYEIDKGLRRKLGETDDEFRRRILMTGRAG